MGKKEDILSRNTNTYGYSIWHRGVFFKSEEKQIRQETWNGKISEIILDDENTTSCKKYCRTTRKREKENQQILSF